MRDTWVTSLHAATRRGRTRRRVSLASRAEHRGRTLLAAAVAIGTLITVAPLVSSASAAVSSTSILNGDGTVATTTASGSQATYVTNAPITLSGTTNQTLQQTFDPANSPVTGVVKVVNGAPVTVPDVIAPDGYSVQYYDTSTSTWSSTIPAYNAATNSFPTLGGVRAVGAITVTGGDASTSQETVVNTTSNAPAAISGFNGQGNGDGWNVFFGYGSAFGRVFNIYHHSGGTFTVDCHMRVDSSSCWGHDYTLPGTYDTSAHSAGYYWAPTDSVYALVGSPQGLGIACVAGVSTAVPHPCSIGFTVLDSSLGTSDVFSGNGPGDLVQVGTKLYARPEASSKYMYCFDMASQSTCSGSPYALSSTPVQSDGAFGDNYQLVIGSKIIFETGYYVGCFDTNTNALCSTFNSGMLLSTSAQGSLFETTDSLGAPSGFCSYNSQTCFTMAGAGASWPANMPAYNSSLAGGWGEGTTVGTKYYYFNNDLAVCYDFAIMNPCAGFTPSQMGSYAYTIVQDPNIAGCMWSNSDGHQIVTFDPVTGLSPCNQKATVLFPYQLALPRLACNDAQRLSTWQNLTLTPPTGLSLSNARITILDSYNQPIPGWQGVSVDPTTGFLDLSTLSASATGVHPTVEVTYLGATDATGTSIAFTFTAAAPQLCVVVKSNASCPTGVGPGASSFPVNLGSLGVTSTVTEDNGGPASEITTGSVTHTLAGSDCLLTPISGHVYLLTDHGAPANGVTLYLYGPDGSTVVATTTADANGYYHFDNIFPNTYEVGFTAANPNGSTATGLTSLSCKATDYCTNSLPDLVVPYVTLTYTGPLAGNYRAGVIGPLRVTESPTENCTIGLSGYDSSTGASFGPLYASSSGGVAIFNHGFIDAGVYRISLWTPSGQDCVGIPDDTGVLVSRPDVVGRVLSLGAGMLNTPGPNFGLQFDTLPNYSCRYSVCFKDHVLWSQRGSWFFDGTVNQYLDGSRPSFNASGTLYYWQPGGLSGTWVAETTGSAVFHISTKGGFGVSRWVTGGGQVSISGSFTGVRAAGAPPLPSFGWTQLQ